MADRQELTQAPDLAELSKRVEWMDEQRRTAARRTAELEQKFELQEREIARRDERIAALERDLAAVQNALARIPQVDVQLTTFRDEMMEQIEGYDKRRLTAEKELDRLRRIENENLNREISEIRKELPAIGRLQNAMELRVAEESRLGKLIGSIQTTYDPLRGQIAEAERSVTFLAEKEKQNSRAIGDIQTQFLEINKRWDPINGRIDILANTLAKLDAGRQDLIDSQIGQREIIKKWAEQIQIGEHDRNKQLEKWRFTLEEHKDAMERYAREWITYADKFKEASMALQTLAEWQKQTEQQQGELSEQLRIELSRMQSRWDGFTLQDEQKWRTAQVDVEQRQQTIDRANKQIREAIQELSERLLEFEEDKDMLWRMHGAQADAVRQLPRIWLEEIEKARALDPNRRRQPTIVPVREE
jgi:chromosome segregation ATPase